MYYFLAYAVIIDLRPSSGVPYETIYKSLEEFLTMVSVLCGPQRLSMFGLFCVGDIETKVSLLFACSMESNILSFAKV